MATVTNHEGNKEKQMTKVTIPYSLH